MNVYYVFVLTLAGVALVSGDITLSVPEPRVVRGITSSLIVSCSGAVGIAWINPAGKQITTPMTGRIHLESNQKQGVSLVIRNIVKQDKGNYTCKSTTDSSVAPKSFELLVIEPLSFVDTPSVQTAALHSNVVLRCEVLGDFEPTITWQRDAKTIEGTVSGSHYKIVSDGLTIMDATLEDEGVYVCRAFQVAEVITNTLERNITLRIEHAPMLLEKGNHSIAYGLVGGTVNITCAVKAFPDARFMWMRDGHELTPATHNVSLFAVDNVGVLQMEVYNETVFGNYTCKAKNKLGEKEREIVLQKGTKPEPPTSVTAEPSDDGDSVILNIEDTDNGDMATIGYWVQYRPKGNDVAWDRAHFVDFKKGSKPYRISGLAQNVDYEMRVAVRNAAGLSDFSPELSYKNPQAQAEHVSSLAAAAATNNTLLLLLRLAGLLLLLLRRP